MRFATVLICGASIFACVFGGAPAHAHFLQTDPIGYKDSLNLYAYVGDDPVNHSDPTGLTCTGSGDKLDCHVDQVTAQDKNGKDRQLTTTEQKQLTATNKAYTAAVKQLLSDPSKAVTIKVGEKSFSVTAGQVAASLEKRTVVAQFGQAGAAATTPYPVTFIQSRGLAGTAGPEGQRGGPAGQFVDREITLIHEGIHRGPAEQAAFPLLGDPALTGKAHSPAYDNASRDLLGVPKE